MDHVHHMLVYRCADLTNSSAASTNEPCHSIPSEAQACRANILLGAWAIGAEVRNTF